MRGSIFLIFLLLLPFTSASLELYGADFISGETLQVKITEFSDLDVSDLSLINSDNINVGKILLNLPDGNYFAYFDLPNDLATGSYSIFVEGMKNGEYTNESESFYITYHNLTKDYISVKPGGFVISDGNDQVDLSIFNWGAKTLDLFVTSDEGINPVRTGLSIESGASRTLTINVDESIVDEKILTLTYSNGTMYIPFFFELPEELVCLEDETMAYLCPDGTEVEWCQCDIKENAWVCVNSPENSCPEEEPNLTIEEEVIEGELQLMIEDNYLEQSLTQNQRLTAEIPVYNNFDFTLTNIEVSLGGNLADIVTVDPSYIESLEPYEIRDLSLIVNDNYDVSGDLFFGTLAIISEEGYSDSVTLSFEVFESSTEEETTEELGFNYSDLSLEIVEEKNRTRNQIIGIILLVILTITIILLWKRLKPRISSRKLSDVGK